MNLVSASLTHVVSPKLLVELRAGYNRFDESFFPEDSSFDPNSIGLNTESDPQDFGLPQISVGDYATIGGNNYLPRGRVDTNWQGFANLSYSTGRHRMKAGYEYRRTTVNQYFNAGYRGVLNFDSLEDFVAGRVAGGRQSQGDSNRETFHLGDARFIEPSWVVWVNEDSVLQAQRLDIEHATLEGPIHVLADGVGFNAPNGITQVSGGRDFLAWRSERAALHQLIVVDRTGRQVRSLGEPAEYQDPQLSDDGRRVAVEIGADNIGPGRRRVLVLDTRGDAPPVALATGAKDEGQPVLSPDGDAIAFGTRAQGFPDRSRIWVRGLSEAGSGRELSVPGVLDDWTRDERYLISTQLDGTAPDAAPSDTVLQNLTGLVDEIRLHPPVECWDHVLETDFIAAIRHARELGFEAGFEVPALPGIGYLEAALPDLDFLNINELEWGETNAAEMRSRSLHPEDSVHNAVAGSRDWAFSISRHENVWFCSSAFKDSVQLRKRLLRVARNTARPFDEVTEDGTVVYGLVENVRAFPSVRGKLSH